MQWCKWDTPQQLENGMFVLVCVNCERDPMVIKHPRCRRVCVADPTPARRIRLGDRVAMFLKRRGITKSQYNKLLIIMRIRKPQRGTGCSGCDWRQLILNQFDDWLVAKYLQVLQFPRVCFGILQRFGRLGRFAPVVRRNSNSAADGNP